jgi:hypothetical protein
MMYPGGNHRFTHMKELIEDFKKMEALSLWSKK